MSKTMGEVLVIGVNYPPEHTGIAPYTGDLATGLAREFGGCEVITTNPHYPNWRVWQGYGGRKATSLIEGVQVTRLAHYVPKKPVGIRRLLSEVTFGLHTVITKWPKVSTLILVSPAMVSSWLVVVKARLFYPRTRVVIWVQDLYRAGLSETGQGAGLGAAVIGALESDLLRRADKVVAIHQRMADRIARECGVEGSNISVIRNWTHIDLSEDPSEVSRADVRATLGWQQDHYVVLHTGNMGTKQGLVNVVEAAKLALEQDPNLLFVLMGDGHERRKLESLGLAVDTLRIIDPVDEGIYLATLQAADVLLVNELPELSEMAVPSKLTSYFAAGRSVLAATSIGGVTAQEVEASGAGVHVPAGNPQALLEAVMAIKGEAEKAAALGAAGPAYVSSTLTKAVSYTHLTLPTTSRV